MNIVAVTRILDEADIVEAFVRHTAAHVGHHLLLDNGSRDGTLEILEKLAAEGLPITVFGTGSVAFSEARVNTWLFWQAALEHEANWVVFLDADEFIDDRQAPGGLAGLLATCDAAEAPPMQVLVDLTDYIAIVHDVEGEVCVPRRIQWRAERWGNHKTIVSTRAGVAGIAIAPGGHGAHRAGTETLLEPAVIEPLLTHAHYGERNSWQWMVKLVRGWVKVLASGEANERLGRSTHYRDGFELLRDDPGAIFHNAQVMGFKNERPGLVHDPIDYRGGELRYFRSEEPSMRAARLLTGFVEDLARRHGRLLDAVPAARALEEELDQPRLL